ncbi:MAG: DEAD/DEAH box helicase [Saprospirales bacterium]|nr:DEAD/DEAH box helicase [Saprospirales bacterium]MBK8920670.1 DEAD/DEAH box helicase [Saprospirales bacterium]
MEFTEFDLHPDLLAGIESLNFKSATPIQEQAIPLILEGKDLIGIAQTGTGKTAAFILPILNRILELPDEHYIKALVVVPTRELAVQIDQAVEAYAYFTGLSCIAVYGGSGGNEFSQERNAITRGVDLIIATPGRLIAHMNMGYVDFSRLHFLVLDEADRMLDMGFQPDLMRIIDKTNPKRQNLLFSATMPHGVMKLARTLMQNPVTVSIALSKPAEGVRQGAYVIHDEQKIPLLQELLQDRAGQRILVFSSTKQGVSKLFQKLKSRNLNVGQISSDLEQTEREKVMLAFRNRQIDVLVATDVLSRGIDIDGIDLVVNYDVPQDAEDYVHRVGRTARAAREGVALTLINPTDQRRFQRIEALIGNEVEKLPVPAQLGATPAYAPKSQRPPHSGKGPGNSTGGKKPPFRGRNRSGKRRETPPGHKEPRR